MLPCARATSLQPAPLFSLLHSFSASLVARFALSGSKSMSAINRKQKQVAKGCRFCNRTCMNPGSLARHEAACPKKASEDASRVDGNVAVSEYDELFFDAIEVGDLIVQKESFSQNEKDRLCEARAAMEKLLSTTAVLKDKLPSICDAFDLVLLRPSTFTESDFSIAVVANDVTVSTTTFCELSDASCFLETTLAKQKTWNEVDEALRIESVSRDCVSVSRAQDATPAERRLSKDAYDVTWVALRSRSDSGGSNVRNSSADIQKKKKKKASSPNVDSSDSSLSDAHSDASFDEEVEKSSIAIIVSQKIERLEKAVLDERRGYISKRRLELDDQCVDMCMPVDEANRIASANDLQARNEAVDKFPASMQANRLRSALAEFENRAKAMRKCANTMRSMLEDYEPDKNDAESATDAASSSASASFAIRTR